MAAQITSKGSSKIGSNRWKPHPSVTSHKNKDGISGSHHTAHHNLYGMNSLQDCLGKETEIASFGKVPIVCKQSMCLNKHCSSMIISTYQRSIHPSMHLSNSSASGNSNVHQVKKHVYWHILWFLLLEHLKQRSEFFSQQSSPLFL